MGNILTKQFYRQRKDFEDSCAGRDAGLTFPEGVRCSTDIAYADDGIKAHMLDIYRLEDSQEKILPIIINVHGGGLIIGNKEFNRYFCALLCNCKRSCERLVKYKKTKTECRCHYLDTTPLYGR